MINGLEEMRKIHDAWSTWEEYMDCRINGDRWRGKSTPTKPSESIAEAAIRLPIAAAYIYAEAFTLGMNLDKYSAGKKAMARLEAGENPTQVIADMEAEFSAAALSKED